MRTFNRHDCARQQCRTKNDASHALLLRGSLQGVQPKSLEKQFAACPVSVPPFMRAIHRWRAKILSLANRAGPEFDFGIPANKMSSVRCLPIAQGRPSWRQHSEGG